MWWAVWCAAVVAAGAGAAAAPAPDSLGPLPALDLEQIDASAPDDESVDYGLSPGGRYSRADDAGAGWLYYYPGPQATRVSKKAEALSHRGRRGFAVNPAVDVLQRGYYKNYITDVAHHNRAFLDCIGKRDPASSMDCKLKM